jgi:hypothetical protein
MKAELRYLAAEVSADFPTVTRPANECLAGGEKLKAAQGTDANANTDYRIQVPNAPSFMACLLCAVSDHNQSCTYVRT